MHPSVFSCLWLPVVFFTALPLLAGEAYTSPSDGQAFYYSFTSPDKKVGSGVAELVVSPRGDIRSHRILVADKRFKKPLKVAVSPDGRFVAATSENKNLCNLALFDLQSNTGRVVSFPRELDAIEPWGGGFVIGAGEGVIYYFDPATGQKLRYNLRQNTYPPARKAEYILVDGDHAWITIQKDSSAQSTKGSRVLYFDLANWRLKHDLLMARDRPDLELNSFKERGPSPEIILVSERSNTLLLSMDRYGGVCLTDLDAARRGLWRNRSNHSTALDGKFGTAFPDRWVQFSFAGQDYALITNAGEGGGAALVDMAERKVIQRLELPPGVENPTWFPQHGLLLAGIPGKVKRVYGQTLAEDRAPVNSLLVLRAVKTPAGPRLEPTFYPTDKPLGRGYAIHKSDGLAVFPARNELLVLNGKNGQVVSRVDSFGKISRLGTK